MLTAEFAAKQIKRMAQMKNYPRGEDGEEARKELVKALQTAASEDQAKAVIAGYVEHATGDTPCPFPGEIRKAVKSMQDETRPDPLCHICGGDGWRSITRGGYHGSERCACWAPRPAPTFEGVALPGTPGYVN